MEQLLGEGSRAASKCVSWKTSRAVIIFIPVCSCFSKGSGQSSLALEVARKREQGKIVFLH